VISFYFKVLEKELIILDSSSIMIKILMKIATNHYSLITIHCFNPHRSCDEHFHGANIIRYKEFKNYIFVMAKPKLCTNAVYL